jgi:hypothetical protein
VGSFRSRSLSALHRFLNLHPRYCHDLEVFIESVELSPFTLHPRQRYCSPRCRSRSACCGAAVHPEDSPF